jgi:hypothetical protein
MRLRVILSTGQLLLLFLSLDSDSKPGGLDGQGEVCRPISSYSFAVRVPTMAAMLGSTRGARERHHGGRPWSVENNIKGVVVTVDVAPLLDR